MVGHAPSVACVAARQYFVEGRYLVLEDDEAIPPRESWVGWSDLHVRGRQHVDHLEKLRQRLAHGFALARALNRTARCCE